MSAAMQNKVCHVTALHFGLLKLLFDYKVGFKYPLDLKVYVNNRIYKKARIT